MKILALDFATRKTGYAIFIEGELVDYGVFKSNSDNIHERILQIRENIVNKLSNFGEMDSIILEETPMGSKNNLKVAHDLCVGQGMILGLCCQLGLGLSLYFPTAWRSIVGTYDGTREGTKRANQKTKAVDIVNNLYNLNFKYYPSDTKKHTSDDDICEAILLGLAYLKENKNE